MPSAAEPRSPEALPAGWSHREARVGRVRLHYVEAGSGPLVVLLHGFPEFWWGWRRQIPALVAAGYRVVAADLRGYNQSERPSGARHYTLDELVRDVVGLIDHLGEARASIAGHDWGGIIAWYVAMLHPGRVEKLIVGNAPHPVAFARELKTPGQLRRSWYLFFLQIPWLPEALIGARRHALLRRIFEREPAREGAFTDADVRAYVEAASGPGALTAMLDYYRAGRVAAPPRPREITLPTLLLWGMKDPHLTPRLTEGLDRWVLRLRVERIPDASHWVLADAPEEVSRRMIEFLDAE